MHVEPTRKHRRHYYKYRTLGAIEMDSKRRFIAFGHTLKETGVADTMKVPVGFCTLAVVQFPALPPSLR